MNFKNISDTELLENLKQCAATEREATVQVLWLLREVESRMLHASRGYPSLFAYCLSELKYSESAAMRRISSMRLLRDLPEAARMQVEKKITNGELNLSHLAQVQQHCRQKALQAKENEKANRKEKLSENKGDQSIMTFENAPDINQSTKTNPVPHPLENILQEKLALIDKVSNTSTRECERVLASLSSEPPHKKETIRAVGAEDSRVTFMIPRNLMEKIERIQNARSHQLKCRSILELLTFLVDEEIKRDDKKKNIKTKPKGAVSNLLPHRQSKQDPLEELIPDTFGKNEVNRIETFLKNHSESKLSPVPEVQKETDSKKNLLKSVPINLKGETISNPNSVKIQSRYIKRKNYRNLYHEADHQCQFADTLTGKRCDSRYLLQVEHCLPFSLGGTNDLENLMLLCATHNALIARRVFGEKILQKDFNTGSWK